MNRNAESALSNVKKAFSEVRVALAETKARARRRAIETWPRTAGALRGVVDSSNTNLTPMDIDAVASRMPGEAVEEQSEALVGDTDGAE
jgi:hypothetical protein